MNAIPVDFALLSDDELARLHAALSALDHVLEPALAGDRLPRDRWQLLGDMVYAESMAVGLALEARGIDPAVFYEAAS